jgi:hypothetical protein
MLSKKAAIVTIKTITGGLQYVIFKLMLDWECCDSNGVCQKFRKNYFLTFVTFLSMLLLIVPYYYAEVRDFNASRKIAGQPSSYPYNLRSHLLTVFPAILEVAGVLLSFEANNTIGATTMLLLKSLRIPVSAFLTKFLVGRAQKRYQWLAVGITMIGLIPVGMSESHGKSRAADFTKTIISIGLIVVSEILKGIRYVYEEKLIKLEKISSEFLVFMESIIGLFIASIVLISVNYMETDGNPRESLAVTWSQISSNLALQLMLPANILLVGTHNYATTLITEHLSSIHNVLISQFRTIVSFAVCVMIHYWISPNYGEDINLFTPLKVLGFGLFIYAALLYNGNVKVPFQACYPVEEQNAGAVEAEVKSRSTSEGGDKKETELQVI